MTGDLHPRTIAASGPNRSAIVDVAVAPEGARYAACFGQTLLIGDWASGEETRRLELEAKAAALAFAPDGGRIACACANGNIYVLDPGGPGESGVLTGENGGYYEIAWSPDGRWIAGGHYDPLVSLFEVSGREPPKTLDPEIFSDEGRTAVAFSPDGATLASTAYNAILRWSMAGQKRKKVALKGYAFFLDVAFAPDSKAFAAIAETESRMTLHVWEEGGLRKRGKVELPGFSQRIAWSADGSLVAVIECEAPGLSLWNPESLQRSELAVGGVDMAMSALAAHPSRTGFIAGSEHGQLVIWEAGKGVDAS